MRSRREGRSKGSPRLEDWSKRLESRGGRSGPTAEPRSPHAIPLDLDRSVDDLYRRRMEGVFGDKHAGVPLLKFPEDLRVYEHLLWLNRVDVVVELGAYMGGSALWFRDRLRTLEGYGLIRNPRVITIDVEVGGAREALSAADPAWADSIELIEGSVTDPELAERVRALVGTDASTLVVDDSAHTFETTMGALEGYSELVSPGGFFVVEDTVNDIAEMRLSEDWPRGVLDAMEEWLASPAGSRFRIRRDMERYGLSCHPLGFLQRTA